LTVTEQEKLDQLKRAVLLALDMRARQKAYFAARTPANLIEAKQAEAAFDKIGHQALHQALQPSPVHPLVEIARLEALAEMQAKFAPPKVFLDEAGPVRDAVWEGLKPNEPTTHG
jgi:hypothetical protein